MLSLRLRRMALVMIGALLLAQPLLATANQRIALIIGNAAYPESPLFNPVNDARALDAALSGLGFETVTVVDGDLRTMQGALLEFTRRIEDDATALVFYAGHGIQANGRNYLVPIDATLESEARLRFEALELSDVLEELEYARSKVNIVVLDACRNNPFMRRFRGGARGLAAVDAATGTLVAYATAPGSVASDGSGSNGLYTQHLLDALQQPGLQAEALFKQVRIGVSDSSGGEQVPWESSSLTGDFVFNQSAVPPLQVPVPQVLATPGGTAQVRMPDAIAAGAEVVFWDSVRAHQDVAGYRAYLAQFPNGTFAGLARARIDALERTTDGPTVPRDQLVVDVVNQTGYTIVRLDVSHESASTWGDDRLRGTPMPNGTQRRVVLGDQASSIFDLRLTDAGGDTYTFSSVDITRGPVRATLDDIDPRRDDGPVAPGTTSGYYVDVTNSTGFMIIKLQVSAASETTWGDDRLGSDILSEGAVHRVDLSGHDSPIFDIRATDADGDTYTLRGIDVSRQDATLTLGNLDGGGSTPAPTPAAYYVDVTNSTGFTIMKLEVSAASDTSWGEDRLGSEVIANGAVHRVDLSGHDSPVFDIRATDADGDTYTFKGIDVSRQDVTITLENLDGATATAASTTDYYVDVTNSTAYTMQLLHISPASSTSWEEDLLGTEVLATGQTKRVSLRGYDSPLFDIRLTDTDGDTYTFRNVNVAERNVDVTGGDID